MHANDMAQRPTCCEECGEAFDVLQLALAFEDRRHKDARADMAPHRAVIDEINLVAPRKARMLGDEAMLIALIGVLRFHGEALPADARAALVMIGAELAQRGFMASRIAKAFGMHPEPASPTALQEAGHVH